MNEENTMNKKLFEINDANKIKYRNIFRKHGSFFNIWFKIMRLYTACLIYTFCTKIFNLKIIGMHKNSKML